MRNSIAGMLYIQAVLVIPLVFMQIQDRVTHTYLGLLQVLLRLGNLIHGNNAVMRSCIVILQ